MHQGAPEGQRAQSAVESGSGRGSAPQWPLPTPPPSVNVSKPSRPAKCPDAGGAPVCYV